ncbi:MAG: DUF4238 domain-containing protein [Candidatus Azambacteria bacterium]|nr:DUF4238 domain-containing protein [Candidatus Azambacteria bacterium]
MAKHHIVQDKYLAQWRIGGTQNHLNIFVIPENRCVVGNTKTKLFWRDDFNVLEDDGERSYLPEEVTAIIDTKGIDAIRGINTLSQELTSGIEARSCIAFYVALQYTRTPRHREETNKLIEATTRYFMRNDLSSPDKVHMSKEKILEHNPQNKMERDALDVISKMTQEEINSQIFEAIHGDTVRIGLTKTGHSKGLLKIDQHAKKIFEMQWLFLVAPKGTSFVTSDSPCFTISTSKLNGLLSPHSTVYFPLRPDICLYIKPSMKSKSEYYMKLDKEQVRDINFLILSNSTDCVVAKDKIHLEKLTRNFDYKNHRKSRDISISESGSYTMFTAE